VVSQVFGLEFDSSICIFVANTELIAFNSRGNLFFNLHYFESVSYDLIMRRDFVGLQHALSYWMTVCAHEIAHNVASGHGKGSSSFPSPLSTTTTSLLLLLIILY
jgi:hypothetical protein